MSYVLDALRRAEADRLRGQVPHLHAPATLGASPGAGARDGRPPSGARRARVVLALLGVAAAVAAAWWWVASPGATTAAGREGGLATGPDATAPRAARGLDDPAPPRAARPSPALPRPDLTPPGPVPDPVALPALARPVPAPPPSAGAVGDEPRATRPLTAPPPMRFGGAFDSPDPQARMLIINGQVWREGDEPAPGWVLERIGLHAARFQTQGRSVELRYDGTGGR